MFSHPTLTRRTAIQAGAVGFARARPRTSDPAPCRNGQALHCEGGHLHLPLRRARPARELRPQARRAGRHSRRVQPIATTHARRPHLRTPAAARGDQRPVGAGPLADAPVERPLARPPHHAHRPERLARRVQPERPKPTDHPSIAAIAGAVTTAAEQPAAGRRAAGAARPQHRPRHPRPVRRRHGPRTAIRGSSRRRRSSRRPTARTPSTSSTTSSAPYDAEAEGVRRPRPEPAARAWTATASAAGSASCSAIDAQRKSLDAAASAEAFDRSRAGRGVAADRCPRAQGVRPEPRRPEGPRPLRPQRLRLVAADGRAAGRGRREPGAGEPRQQRDVGHARQRLPAPEGQAAAADRPASPRCSTTSSSAACSTRR